jgi:hypothetical protein
VQTLADFKRALQTEGTRLETLALATAVKGGRLNVGDIRPVIEANTVGVYLKTEGGSIRGSFLEYGKAGEWQFEEDIARNIKYGYAYRVISQTETGEI